MNQFIKKRPVMLLLALLASVGSAHAQVFKWVGPNGQVNYSDVPPPPDAPQPQKKSFAGNVIDTGDLPFTLADAMKSNPVTLYTGSKCLPCDDGRKLLTARGIPFAEKTISSNADIAMLGKGSVQLPQLIVGQGTLQGFEAGSWNTRLTAAGYPESSKLPRNFRNPAPIAAAPRADVEAAPAATPANLGPSAANPASRPEARQVDPAMPALRF